jgi:multidrug efflux pump subunit AcrA (membrane-fusion protein)
MALVLMSVGAMFVPVSYRVNSNCTAEPVIRSFCVAPHEGLLESTLVEPGEVVKKGQVLARMDGRDIGFQIANVLAEKNRAAKEHDAYLAKGEISESLRADLERLGLDAELNLLKHKQQNLQIKSATDGVVLSGSLDKRENYPVTLGQTLYEIGPLSPLRVELAIPAEEVMHVTTGQMVKFRFDGFGTATITGTVDKLRPSSTIRDDENVFIAEVILPNEDGQVRPGMKGFARVYGREHSLGWTLFHRPWEKIMTAIGF